MEILKVCPRCGSAWQETKAINGGPSEFWRECSNPNCNSYYNTYIPQPHQTEFHKDNHRITANFGGYGSGKTLTSREEAYKHFFLTPNGNTLIGANVISQYEATLKREIEADLPLAFVRSISVIKNYIELINGHRIMWRPFDDPDKLRSYNLTMFIILEASEVKLSAFTQLRTRLRNTSASTFKKDRNGNPVMEKVPGGGEVPIIDHDWRRGIIESNPDSGWIRDDVLLKSDEIYKHGSCCDEYVLLDNERDPNISTHVTSTDANRYLPKDFIAMNTKNKSPWWVNKYIFGSFLYSQGAVYPDVAKCITKPFDMKKHWKRIIAFDYGLVDPSVFLFGAIDEDENRLIIYKEAYEVDNNIEQLAALYFQETKDIPSGGLITTPIIDPKSGPKRDYDKKTLSEHFLDYGIAFQPGFVNKDARIFRTNTYIESGRLLILDTCPNLIRELREYKFRADDRLQNGFTDKAQDGNDHAISCLEWICMWLPSDPKNLTYGAYDKIGRDLAAERERETPGYWALRDDDDDYSDTGSNESVYGIETVNYNYF